MPVASRAQDEQLLLWLMDHADGLGWAEIQRRHGGTRGNIQNSCKAVREADVALCGPGVAWFYEKGAACGPGVAWAYDQGACR